MTTPGPHADGPDPATAYDVREQLGKGAFGDVFLVVERASGKRWVVCVCGGREARGQGEWKRWWDALSLEQQPEVLRNSTACLRLVTLQLRDEED